MRKIAFCSRCSFWELLEPTACLAIYLSSSLVFHKTYNLRTPTAVHKIALFLLLSWFVAAHFCFYVEQKCFAVGIVSACVLGCRRVKPHIQWGEKKDSQNKRNENMVLCFTSTTVFIAFSLAVNSAPPSWDEIMKLKRNENWNERNQKNAALRTNRRPARERKKMPQS